MVLENLKNTIKKHFDPIDGLRAKTDSGAMLCNIQEADLKKPNNFENQKKGKGQIKWV